jgi:hypothetical protein
MQDGAGLSDSRECQANLNLSSCISIKVSPLPHACTIGVRTLRNAASRSLVLQRSSGKIQLHHMRA